MTSPGAPNLRQLLDDLASAPVLRQEVEFDRILGTVRSVLDLADEIDANARVRDAEGHLVYEARDRRPMHEAAEGIRRTVNAGLTACRRCKGHGWTGPNDPRPGVTCDDCDGTGTYPKHDHSWTEDRVGGPSFHVRQVCVVCRARRTIAA